MCTLSNHGDARKQSVIRVHASGNASVFFNDMNGIGLLIFFIFCDLPSNLEKLSIKNERRNNYKITSKVGIIQIFVMRLHFNNSKLAVLIHLAIKPMK